MRYDEEHDFYILNDEEKELWEEAPRGENGLPWSFPEDATMEQIKAYYETEEAKKRCLPRGNR